MVTRLSTGEDSLTFPCLPQKRVMLQAETCIKFNGKCVVWFANCPECNMVNITIEGLLVEEVIADRWDSWGKTRLYFYCLDQMQKRICRFIKYGYMWNFRLLFVCFFFNLLSSNLTRICTVGLTSISRAHVINFPVFCLSVQTLGLHSETPCKPQQNTTISSVKFC